MYKPIRSIMCIQCSRCFTVYACRNNPYHKFMWAKFNEISKDAMVCPANFNFVANCEECYK